MPLPGNVTTATVTGKFLDGTGAALTGKILLVPSTPILNPGGAVILSAPITLTLDGAGAIPATAILATNSANINPTGFTWQAIFEVNEAGWQPFAFAAASGTTIDLATVAPVGSSSGQAVFGPTVDASTLTLGTLNSARLPTVPANKIADLSATYAPFISGTIGDGVADDTAAINAYLATSGASLARLRNGKNYLISAPLVVQSGQTLDARGATITLAAGSNCNLLKNAAATAQRSVADAAITSGTNTLTSATAAFTSSDTGRTAVVAGALLGGYVLVATMTYVNATTVTLSLNAGATVSGAALSIYNRDTGIRILGGTWARGSNAGSGTGLHNLMFRHVDGLTVRDLTITSSAGKYAINFGDCSNFLVDNITFNTSSDGVHLNGPCSKFTVRHLFGKTGDDAFAITPNDYAAYNDTVGDVTDGSVENVYVSDASRIVNILGGSPATATRRIRLRNIFGNGTNGAQPGIIIGDDPAQSSTVGGRIDEIQMENVSTAVVAGQSLIKLNGTNTGRLRFKGVTFDDSTSNAAIFNLAAASGTMGSIIIEDLNVLNTNATQIIFTSSTTPVTHMLIDRFVTNGGGASTPSVIQPSALITDLTIKGGQHTPGAGGYVITFGSAGGVTRLTMSDIHMIATGGGLIQTTVATSSLPNVDISNCSLSGTAWLVDLGGTTELHLSGVTLKSPTQGIANIRSTAVVTASGDGTALAAGGQNWKVTAGGKVAVRVLDAPPSTTAGGFPTIAAGAGAGTGPTVTVAGTDRAGTVTVVVGTTPAAGVLATITFVGTWPQAPKVVLTPTLTAASQAAGAYVSAKTTTTFVISTANAPAGTVTFDYVIAD